MTTKTKERQPTPRQFGKPDPGMFAALTLDQNILVNRLITAGWYVQRAVYSTDETWWETAEILDDLGLAWDIAFTSQNSRKAENQAAA
jgi:hypothetical protein